MVAAIILDLDGTLLNSESVNLLAAKKTFQSKGIELDEEDLKLVAGRHPLQFIPIFGIKYNIPKSEQKQVFQLEKQTYHEIWDEKSEMREGAMDFLKTLKTAKKKIALATNSGDDSVKKFLKKFQLESFFDVIITGDQVTNRKPNPEIYLQCVNKLKLPVSEIAVIEDAEPGIIAAYEAGLKVYAIPNPSTLHHDFSKSEQVVHKFSDLEPLLL